MPLPAFRRRLLQIASPAGPTALGGANPAARAARRLMVTPWFAVAAGFVVAAGVWMYSPHAELQFPIGKGHVVQCDASHCAGSQRKNHGVPASAGNMPILGGNAAGSSTRHLRRVTYRLLWQSQGRIFLLINISGQDLPRIWHLSFALPGVDITGIEGAAWQQSGRSSGTASWPARNASWQTFVGLTGSGDRNSKAPWYQPGRSFVVIGTGVPVTPKVCSFNKVRCEFVSASTTGGQSASSGLQSR